MNDFLSSPSRNLRLAGGLAVVLLGGLTALVLATNKPVEEAPKGGLLAFEKTCGAPADVGRAIPDECKTTDAINATFGINLMQEIERIHVRMVSTARRIESGELSDPAKYDACVAEELCAPVPLLPADVDVAALDPQSTDYLTERTAFWGLVEDRALGREVCQFIRPCDIAMKTGAMQFESVMPQVQSTPAPSADQIIIQQDTTADE